MKRSERAEIILKELKKLYPSPPIPLDHTNAFTLLVAVVLSAQSTDKKVNELTKELASLAPETMQFGLEAYDKQDSKSFDEALPYLKRALETNPKQGQFWLSYTDALIKLGQHPELIYSRK